MSYFLAKLFWQCILSKFNPVVNKTGSSHRPMSPSEHLTKFLTKHGKLWLQYWNSLCFHLLLLYCLYNFWFPSIPDSLYLSNCPEEYFIVYFLYIRARVYPRATCCARCRSFCSKTLFCVGSWRIEVVVWNDKTSFKW